MAIGQIELQGQISRAQDFTTIKHNEDTRSSVEQANVSTQFARVVEERIKRVNQGEQPEYRNRKFDAKDKGSNEYSGDGGQKRKKEKREADGKVLIKGVGNFDISL